MNKKLFSSLIFALFISGCQQNVAPSKDIAPLEEPSLLSTSEELPLDGSAESEVKVEFDKVAEKSLTPFEKITLGLIDKGNAAFLSKRLLTPEEDNANLYFQAALGRAPGNFEATQGIANIVETYSDWAWQSAKGRGYKQASRYLESARSVNPQDPLIDEVEKRIQDLQQQRVDQAKYAAQRKAEKAKSATDKQDQGDMDEGVYVLPSHLFTLSDDEVIEKLQPIIDDVNDKRVPITISWAKDREARLIYQIINSRTPEFRLRAMIYQRADYKIELQKE